MAVIALEDLHGSIECVVFPRLYEKSPELFREDSILILEGKVDTRSERPQVVVDRAEEWMRPKDGTPPPPPPVPSAPSPSAPPPVPVQRAAPPSTNGHASSNGANGHAVGKRQLHVTVPRNGDDHGCLRVLEQLHALVERWPGKDQVHLVLHDRSGARVELDGAEIMVQHSSDLEAQVRALVGAENLSIRESH
jgi:DNA polymerase-3 subunit alpha